MIAAWLTAMNLHNFEFTTLSAHAASALVSAVWQGFVLAVIVALCLRLLPPVSAAVRSLVWLSAFVAALLLQFVPFLPAASAAPASAHALHADLHWSLLLAAVWLAMSLVHGWQLAVSALHLRRIARGSVPVGSPLQPDLPRGAVLCTSTEVDRPSVAGFFSPRILLPPDLLATLTPAELEQVLLHETEHLRRGDDWINLLQKLALVVFPLNPVLIWIERRLCFERELACDDRVLRVTAARKAYALCLTNLAEHTALRRGLTLALGAWERQSELARRVLRILGAPSRTLSRPQSAAVGGTVMLCLLGAAVSLANTPAVISFLPSAPAGQATAQAWAPVTPEAARFHYASAVLVRRNRGRNNVVLSPVGGNNVQEVLAKATLPAARAAAAPVHARLHRGVPSARTQRAHSIQRAAAIAQEPPVQQIHWTLTLARVGDPVPPLLNTPAPVAQAAATQFSPDLQPAFAHTVTYAAVPFANGWLIIKL